MEEMLDGNSQFALDLVKAIGEEAIHIKEIHLHIVAGKPITIDVVRFLLPSEWGKGKAVTNMISKVAWKKE